MKQILIALIALLIGVPVGVAAQQLTLKRDVPAAAWAGCPKTDGQRKQPTPPVQQAEAERIASSATEASLLGDKNASLDLLTRAAATDPTSRSIASRLARALDEANRQPAALIAYCQYLSIAPDASDAQEVRERTRVLGTPVGFAVSAEARDAFTNGIAQYDAGKFSDAEESFGKASDALATWSAPVFNRAVVRLALMKKDAAEEDLRRYLALSPGAPDFNQVLNQMATSRQPAAAAGKPGSVFLRSVFVPGLGQLTTGRTGRGLVYLGAAAGAITLGVGVTRLKVDCLSEPVNGVCPQDQIAQTRKDKPYLVPSIGAALVIGIISAFDAASGVRKESAQGDSRIGPNEKGRPYITYPAVQVGLGSARVELVRIRF